ncbi:response regulator transcription factor [Faecalicatena contorta]|uniref:Stage 0 sporulation protein A homolog n=1 Tax=Faecalicatena contorta TaxID=39482 RepID=A0A315ZX77_9FIRM|nr:response regulator [Faecalicatena contorta]PWJ49488.1 AraC family two component transcriptional regulator [Faecalicatena contorta]SUQ14732.1 two component transcriptional regulator, AraC family [Faecalicatena contorta]
MMQALIVDDERMIRMGICTAIPWNILGVEKVFSAESGKEALALLSQESIDVMITDIKMTGMTGIELISEIRKIKEDIRIIVLTGYDEFDYARECIRMQVQDFLLKPVDEEVLIDSIRKQVQVVKSRRKIKEEQFHVSRISGISEQMCLESWMRTLVLNKGTTEIIDKICNKYHYARHARMRIAILISSVCPNGVSEGESDFLLRLTIKNILIGYLDAEKQGITFEDDEGRIVLALFEGEKSDQLENCIDTFTKLIQEECNVRIRIVMGNVVEGFEKAALSFNDAMYLWNEEKNEYKTLIEHKGKKGQLDMFREVYAELKNSLNSNIGNTERLLRIFDSFCAATNSYNITDQYVSRCCFEIASSVYFNYVVESGENADSKLNSLLAALLNADRNENYKITKAFLENLLEGEGDDGHELVLQVKRYINEHLTDDITVAGIAQYFYLSPNYFSRLFKRVTNEGCNEYIVRKRIEKAKYILAATNMKIGKIAGDVGYRDSNYFSLAFKKQTGMSPQQYRESVRKMEAL